MVDTTNELANLINIFNDATKEDLEKTLQVMLKKQEEVAIDGYELMKDGIEMVISLLKAFIMSKQDNCQIVA